MIFPVSSGFEFTLLISLSWPVTFQESLGQPEGMVGSVGNNTVALSPTALKRGRGCPLGNLPYAGSRIQAAPPGPGGETRVHAARLPATKTALSSGLDKELGLTAHGM